MRINTALSGKPQSWNYPPGFDIQVRFFNPAFMYLSSSGPVVEKHMVDGEFHSVSYGDGYIKYDGKSDKFKL